MRQFGKLADFAKDSIFRDNLHENVKNLVILAKKLRENGNAWTKLRVF